MTKRNPTAAEVIVPGDQEQLRRRREEWLADIQRDQLQRLESGVVDAAIKRNLDEVDALIAENKKLRAERRRYTSDVAKAQKAQVLLRHNPPAWIQRRLEQITVAVKELREQYGPQRVRAEWLRKKLRELTDRDRAARSELQKKLNQVNQELAEFTQQYDALQAEQHELIKRSTREAWPEPIEADEASESKPKRRRAEAVA